MCVCVPCLFALCCLVLLSLSKRNGWLTSQWISTCHWFLPVSLFTVFLFFGKALPCHYPLTESLSWNVQLPIALCETRFPPYLYVDNNTQRGSILFRLLRKTQLEKCWCSPLHEGVHLKKSINASRANDTLQLICVALWCCKPKPQWVLTVLHN